MRHTQKNLRSTKTQQAPPNVDNDMNPPQETQATNMVFASTVCVDTVTHKIYTDLTGKFPIIARSGTKYILILYDYNSNSILARPLKSRNESEYITVYKNLYY